MCNYFVKSGCEKSWAEVQADSYSFECRGCGEMKWSGVEMEQWRQLVALVGREEVGFANKVGEGDERDARKISP